MPDSAVQGNPGKRAYSLLYIAIELLAFLLLSGITALILWPLQRSMQNRMTMLRDRLIGQAETLLHREIEYDSIGPSLFGNLDIRNIRVYGESAREDPVATIARFRVSYSFRDLITGDFMKVIRSIRVDQPVVSADFERDADLIALCSSFSARPEFWENLGALSEDLSIRVRGGGFTLSGGDRRYSVNGLSFEASMQEGRILIGGTWRGEVRADFLNQPLGLSAACGISGEFIPALLQGSLNISFPLFLGNTFSLRGLILNLTLAERRLELRKISDRSPFDLYLGYDIPSRSLEGEFAAEEFSVGDMVSLTGAWENYNPWIRGLISGHARLRADGEGVSYEFDLTDSYTPVRSLKGWTLRGQGDASRIDFDRFLVQFPRGSVMYEGSLGLRPLAPSGLLSLSDFGFTGGDRINARIAVDSDDAGIHFLGAPVFMGRVRFSGLDGRLIREDGGFSFSLALRRFQDAASNSLLLEGSYDYEPRQVQVRLNLDAFSLADAADLARPLAELPRFSGLAGDLIRDLSLSTEMFFTTDFEHVLYNAPGFVINYRGGNVSFTSSLSGTDRRFELREGRIGWEGGEAEIAGDADFSNLQDISFTLQSSYQDLTYYLRGVMLDRRSLSIQGSYGLNVYLSMTDYGGYSGYAEAEDVPIPLGGRVARLNFLTGLRYDSPDFWSLDLDRFDLVDLPSPASSAMLSIQGGADQNGARLSRLFFDDGRGALSGQAGVSWNGDFSVIRGNALMESQGEERYTLDGGYEDGSLRLRLNASQVQLGRFIPGGGGALMTGTAQLEWKSGESYSAELFISSLSAQIRDQTLRGSGWGMLGGTSLEFKDLRLDYGTLSVEIPRFSLDLREARGEAEARLRGTVVGRPLDFSFGAEADFTPVNSWLSLGRAFGSFNAVLHVHDAFLDTVVSREPFDLRFTRTESDLLLSGGPGNMIRLQLSREGDFYAGLSFPSPVRGAITGTLNSRSIDIQSPNLYVDMASLWRFIPRKDIINFAGGFVTASVAIRGSPEDPEFFGIAQGNSLRIQVPRFLGEDIGPVPVTVVLDGNEMSFGPQGVPVGKGESVVSGWFRFERWIPNTFTIDIEVPPESPIPYSLDIMGIQAKGLTDGLLKLDMLDYVLTVTGNLRAQDTQMTMDTQRIGQMVDYGYGPSRVSVVTDLTIRTGRKVEFAWPQAMPILQAYVDAGPGMRITSDNNTGRYSLAGDVALRSGEIYYFQRSFYIREGTLSFNENEIRFDPRISARAEIRDRTDEGPVTISMFIENAPLLSFTARFESNPPLSQREIFSFLGQNLAGTPSGEDETIHNPFILASSDILSQLGFIRQGERYIRDFLHLDMFSVRTQILQKAIFQATGLRDPVDRNAGVGNYFDKTTIFLGKYITPDMFVQAMLSMRYDENETRLGGLVFEPDIGIELQSPLMAIRFNFVPAHYENLFVNDLSFTLTWRWSF